METQLKKKTKNKKEGEENKMKNNLLRKNLKNNEKGITLISLVVTIIVLLILAGVAIMMLRGDNGILNRASEAKYTNVISGFDEQVKLASISVRTSIEANKVSKPGYIATTEENTQTLATEVAKELGLTGAILGNASNTQKISTEGYTVAYYLDTKGDSTTNGNTYIVIWYTDNSLRSTLNRAEISKYGLKDVAKNNTSVNQAILVSVIHIENYNSELFQNGITSTTDADIDIAKNNLSETTIIEKGLNTVVAGTNDGTAGAGAGTGGLTGVNFGEGKTASDVAQGDTISITFGPGDSAYTEQFMVITKYESENKIMAMPYYNITLPNPLAPAENGTYPRQASSGTGTTAFSGSQYWTEAGKNIEPMSSSNIQQYITAYSTKLSNATNGKVTAEVGRYYGDHALSSFSGQSSGGKKILNPSGTGTFWLGSSYSISADIVWNVGSSGSFGHSAFILSSTCGVRPVIFISLS